MRLLMLYDVPPPAVGGVGWLRPHCRGESRFQCPDHFRGQYPEPTPAPMLHHPSYYHQHHRHHGHDRLIACIALIAIMAIIASSPSLPSWPGSPHRHHGHDRLIAIMVHHRLIATMAIIASPPSWPSSPHRHHVHQHLIASIAIIARPVSRPVLDLKYRIYSINAVPE